tara:strand:+ start:428 stop:700 length:273 start_codon:yes stop_codon:yes gene_type:complete
MKDNTNKITSMAQALGCLVMNGFNVDYESCEYGVSIDVKNGNGWARLPHFDIGRITVSEIIELASEAVKKRPIASMSEQPKTFDQLINLF